MRGDEHVLDDVLDVAARSREPADPARDTLDVVPVDLVEVERHDPPLRDATTSSTAAQRDPTTSSAVTAGAQPPRSITVARPAPATIGVRRSGAGGVGRARTSTASVGSTPCAPLSHVAITTAMAVTSCSQL